MASSTAACPHPCPPPEGEGENSLRRFREQLATDLDRITGAKKDTRIFLRADKAVGYGDFMEVMNLLRDAGYLKIALVGLESLPQGQTEAQPQAESPATQGGTQ